MKVGSLVECIKGFINHSPFKIYEIKKDERLIIREIFPSLDGGFGLRFEGVVNEINPYNGREIGYDIERFRELLPPEEIAEALEKVEKIVREQPVPAEKESEVLV